MRSNSVPAPDSVSTQEEKKSESTSTRKHPFWQTVFSAGAGGGMGGFLFSSMEILKKQAQTDQPVKLSMRGSAAFATCVMTASVVQIPLNQAIQSIKGFDHNSNVHKGLAAAASGGVGGVFSTWVENTILWQQLNKCGPRAAMVGMLNEGIRRPFVGLLPLMGREIGFGLSMLFFGPLAGKHASEQWGPAWEVPGTIAAGMAVGVGTHGLDTWASRMQKDQVGMKEAFNSIRQKHGWQGFLKGVGYRAGVLFPGATLTIPFFTGKVQQGIEKVEDEVTNWNKPRQR
jgi:hypothetical protein